ncbi:MAG: methylmalonyl-CoA mutase family protein, partial [Chloroflexota bacterium]|nr:methylmalonyl-CoA mutase family protein [Chloroflexota bacterium]
MPQEKGKSEVIKTRLNYAAKEFYTPEDIAEIDYTRDIGNPSEYPFTRGVYRDMYRGRLWTMRELVGFGTPEDTREKVKALTKEGTTGLAMICDLPTYLGIEPDHPLAEAAVGLEGIPFYTLRDMETFLDGIPMESWPLWRPRTSAGSRGRRWPRCRPWWPSP